MNAITTVEQYLAASRNDPRLRRTTLHYIADMIDYFGKERVFEGIYGMDRQISDIIAFFKGYAMSMERRLLLLVGPQGSGKSMTVDKLKRWLEEYSHKPDGALYAVDGCPFHQHPFDVIPPADREAEGVWWHEEAVPCPVCERIIARSAGGGRCPSGRSSSPHGTRSGWPSIPRRTSGGKTSPTSSGTSTSPCSRSAGRPTTPRPTTSRGR